jgi:hypothetical protein
MYKVGFLASSARTASGNQGSTFLPVRRADVLNVLVNVTAVSGTTPSLTLSLQWSNDGTTWADADAADAFTAITAAGVKAKQFPVKAQYARLAWAITGTTPSFTFSADLGWSDPANLV